MAKLFKTPDQFKSKSNLIESTYQAWQELADTNPEAFWDQQAKRLDWHQKWNITKQVSFHRPVSIKWFIDGKLNVSENCIDRHLATKKDKTAIIWESDSVTEPSRHITYQELYDEVNKMSLVLSRLGVRKGSCVTIYMPMIPEAAFAMLACARIGAMHSVVFGGFSPDSISDRIQDGRSEFVITTNFGYRAGKKISLKSNMDVALQKTPFVKKVLVVDRGADNNTQMVLGRDHWWHEERMSTQGVYQPESMDSEDPLFILYTSGSTGKPKGVLHTTGGYLTYASYTHKYVFDIKDDDVYWCTADVGWVTGHSYLVYGPLSNGSTTLMFEGVPSYPNASRFWQIIDKHKVSVFYTAPTALRALMREGDEHVTSTSRSSLRLLGSVGEPINPEAWIWYHKVVGDSKCPIVDTWWQTETGGILISPLPGVIDQKPGSATKPLPGIKPKILNTEGTELKGQAEGLLVLADSWPGQMRTVFGDHKRFEETYFSAFPGYYFTGDGCRRDEDGYYWITGRVDDVLNVSGHRLGTAEIESALVAHKAVAESAVVGYPHDIKGQGIYVYVTLKQGFESSEDLRKELINWVAKEISPIAKPDLLQWAPGLPKTRSGKIMRRILRKIAENAPDQLGDTSTLADPAVVDDLVKNRLNVS